MHKIVWMAEQYITWKNNENNETPNSRVIKKLMIFIFILFLAAFYIKILKIKIF